jgi:hypothetical protein
MKAGAFGAAALVAFTCAFGASRTWTGGGDGLRWSDAANWGGTVPGAEDDVLIENTSGATLYTSNDIPNLSIAHLLPGGTSPVTISGNALTITGDGNSWSNNVDTVCNAPIKFTGTGPKMKFGNLATFNADVVSTASSGKITLEGKSNGYFYGRFLATNQNLVCYMNNGVSHFHKPIYVNNITFDGYIYGALRFHATNNVVGTISPRLWTCEMTCENAFATNTIWSWDSGYAENSTGRSFYQLNGHDQLIDRFGGSVRKETSGALNPGCYAVRSTSLATLTLRATADCTTYANVFENIALVWDPVADYTLHMPERKHATVGPITVKRGVMRISNVGSFANSTGVTVADGAEFDMASTRTDARPLKNVTSIVLGENSRFVVTNRTAAFIADSQAVLRIRSSSRLVLCADLAQSVKKVLVDGFQIVAGTYTGQGGATGTVVPWITGTGTITVTEDRSGTWWEGGSDSDFNNAENWTDGVPTVGLGGYITKFGDITVNLAAAPSAVVESLTLNNETGSTVLNVTAPVSLEGGAVSVGMGAEVKVKQGGEWTHDFTGAASADAVETFALHNGGKFSVEGGFVSFTNTTGRLAIGGSSTGDEGTLEISSGTCILKRTSGDFVVLNKHGLLKMTGGLLQTRNFNSIGQYGGTIDLSGDAKIVSTFGGFDTPLRTVTLRMRGNSVFKNTPESQSRWYFNPNASGNTCLIDMDDDAFVDVQADSLYLCNRNGGKTIVRMRGRSKLYSANGVYAGCGAGAYGEIDIGGTAYFKQEYYDYGINIGSDSTSTSQPAVGIIRMSGGRLTTGRSPNTNTGMQGLMVGNGTNGSYSGPTAKGYIYMSDGVITNRNNGVFAIGAGSAEGLVEQSGGKIVHNGSRPLFVGFRGGTGKYEMTGGGLEANNNNVYVGGAPTNAVSYYLANLAADKPAYGTLSVLGGEFKAKRSIYVSFGGYGTLEVGPTGHVDVVQNLYLTNSMDVVNGGTAPAKLKFTTGADGCGCIELGGKCIVAEDAQIEIDASAYTAKKSVKLLVCNGMEGSFSADRITIRAEHPALYSLVQSASGLRLACASGTMIKFH